MRGQEKVQNFPGAPNGARKDLKQLMLGLFRREAAKFFWGIFAKNPEIQQILEKPPLIVPDSAIRGGGSQGNRLISLSPTPLFSNGQKEGGKLYPGAENP